MHFFTKLKKIFNVVYFDKKKNKKKRVNGDSFKLNFLFNIFEHCIIPILPFVLHQSFDDFTIMLKCRK